MEEERLATSYQGALLSLALGVENENFISDSSTVFEKKSRKASNYAQEWARPIKMHLKPNGFAICQIPRGGDLLTSVVLKIYRPTCLETFFPGVPEAFKHNKELFFRCLSILFLQRDFFPKSTSFKSASLTVGRTCISRVHRDFMRMQGCKRKKITNHPLFDPDTMKCGTYTLERFEIPFAIASSTSQTILPLICLDYHDVKVEVEFDGCLGDIVRVDVDSGYVLLDWLERRQFASNRHNFVIQPVNHITRRENVNRAGFVEFDISDFKLATSVIAFRLFDAKGNAVNPLRVAYVVLTVNGLVRLAGSGIDFFTDNLKKDARLDNDINYDEFGMFVFRFQAPTTDHHTDVVPHGMIDLTKVDRTTIQVVLADSTTGEEFTASVFQQHVNVFSTFQGLGSLEHET